MIFDCSLCSSVNYLHKKLWSSWDCSHFYISFLFLAFCRRSGHKRYPCSWLCPWWPGFKVLLVVQSTRCDRVKVPHVSFQRCTSQCILLWWAPWQYARLWLPWCLSRINIHCSGNLAAHQYCRWRTPVTLSHCGALQVAWCSMFTFARLRCWGRCWSTSTCA